MKIKRIALAVLTLGLLLASFQVALAKEIGKVTISGPGLKQPLVINDPSLTSQLGPEGLFTFSARIKKEPADLGTDFYTIDREYISEGEVVTIDHLRYYPNAADGRGLINYISMDGGQASAAGQWFMANSEGEAALLKVLSENGVTLAVSGSKPLKADPAKPVMAEPAKIEPARVEPAQVESAAVAQTPVANLPLLVGGAAILILGVCAGALLARSRRGHAQA